MPFQKGVSGNPGGKPKTLLWREAIERAVTRRSKKKNLKGLDDIADVLLDAAAMGDMAAIRELGDRLDGKPPQALEHSGNLAVSHEAALAELDNPDDDIAGEGTPPTA